MPSPSSQSELIAGSFTGPTTDHRKMSQPMKPPFHVVSHMRMCLHFVEIVGCCCGVMIVLSPYSSVARGVLRVLEHSLCPGHKAYVKVKLLADSYLPWQRHRLCK